MNSRSDSLCRTRGLRRFHGDGHLGFTEPNQIQLEVEPSSVSPGHVFDTSVVDCVTSVMAHDVK
jgi:hypothetical protein